MTDFLDRKRQEITKRLDELGPVVEEYNRLKDAASALASVIGSTASSATSAAAATVTHRRRPGRPRGSVNPASTTSAAAATATAAAIPVEAPRKKPGRPPGRKKVGRPPGSKKAAASAAGGGGRRRGGRPKGSGARTAEALSLVQGQPGITTTELAAKMGIKPNYLYRILPRLEQEGKLEKKGRGWYPNLS